MLAKEKTTIGKKQIKKKSIKNQASIHEVAGDNELQKQPSYSKIRVSSFFWKYHQEQWSWLWKYKNIYFEH